MKNFNNSYRLMPTVVTIIFIASMLLIGCSAVETRPAGSIDSADSAVTMCQDLYREVDTAIDVAGVRDYGSSMIHGVPYLRTTRLLASFNQELSDKTPQWSAWIGHMADLDAQARVLELRNLSSSLFDQKKDTLHDELNRCRDLLISVDMMKPEYRHRLRDVAHVPDDYVTWWRILGFYPFTAPIVAAGISAWHRKTHDTFAIPLPSLPVMGKLMRWKPQSSVNTATDIPFSNKPFNAQEINEILYRSRDPLGIPLPTSAELDQLFDQFAPVWEVDVVDNNDRIGMMRWNDGPSVDVTHPTIYRKVSYTRFDNQILLQLNYIVWFRARPGSDIYAGQLDGINWRVTLGPDGEPWLYDAIHNCGCYHEFFPSHHLRLRKDLPSAYFESPLLPQSPPEQQPLVLRIAHRTHFIQRIYHDGVPNHELSTIQANQPIIWKDYDVLRSLPTDDGYRSLFSKYGLIAGTERFERFLLWPMGIRSPGAMRQWGRHSTAFNGRRHFDDAFLIESLFEKTQ